MKIRLTKKLVSAIAALLASLIACVFVCYAWFAENKDVNANNLQTSVKGIDINTFEVVGYYINETTTETTNDDETTTSTTTYKVDSELEGTMKEYGDSLNSSSTDTRITAVLLQITYNISAPSDGTTKSYRMTYEGTSNGLFKNDTDTYGTTYGNYDFVSYLSAVVQFQSVTTPAEETASIASGNEVVFESTALAATNGELSTAITANGEDHVFYLVMDYSATKITEMGDALLSLGGGLSSTIYFIDDLVFVLEEYTQ